MKAIVYDHFGGSNVLQVRDVAKPIPKETEVLIRLYYSGVNPVDYKIREGFFKDAMPHEFPIIPGWEGSGVVEQVGSGVQELDVGDEVYGYFRLPTIGRGTYAEYIAVPEEFVAKIPKSLGKKEASVIALTGLTAWQALFDAAKLTASDTVLIQAAAGGVGGMAVQFAHIKRAKVFATCQEANFSYVKNLGADVVIDYTKEHVQARIKKEMPSGVDVVIDCVGKEAENQSFESIKPNGRYVSIVDRDIAQKVPEGVQAEFVFVQPNKKQLEQINAYFDAEKIVCPEIREFPLDEANIAQDLLYSRHVRGKIALKI